VTSHKTRYIFDINILLNYRGDRLYKQRVKTVDTGPLYT